MSRRPRRSGVGLAALCLLPLAGLGLAPAGGAEVQAVRDLTYFAAEPTAAGTTTLDLWFADADGAAAAEPLLVFVHGGGWQRGDKAHHEQKARYFAQRGFVFASVNYRLHPAVDVATQAHDVAHAISWLARNAATFGVDPERVLLMGHSAGAHLAALVALDPRYLETARFPRRALRGVVLLDGAAYDLTTSASLERELLRTVFGDDLDQRRALSPVHLVAAAPGTPPPFLILHVPTAGSREASQALAAALRERDAEATAIETPGKTHRTLNRELGAEGDGPTSLAVEFLRRIGAR